MATTAGSNAQDLYFRKETAFGEAPSGEYTRFRYTSESLTPTQQSTASQEIRSDRQTADLIRTSVGAGGSVPIEFSAGSFDGLLPGAFASADWSALGITPYTASTISFSAPDSIDDSATGLGDFNSVGQWIKVSGSTSNDGIYRVSSLGAAGSLTVDGGPLVDESAGASITIEAADDTITNGSVLSSYTIEKKWTDLDTVLHEAIVGNVVESLAIECAPNQVLTGALTFTGKRSQGLSASSVSSSVADPTVAGDVFNAIDHAAVIIDGTKYDIVTNLSVTIAHNTRPTEVIGTLGARNVNLGALSVTGSFTTLLEDDDGLYGKLVNFQDAKLALSLIDNDDNAYLLYLPRVKFSEGGIQNQGLNTDIPREFSFQAIRDATLGYTARLHRWTA